MHPLFAFGKRLNLLDLRARSHKTEEGFIPDEEISVSSLVQTMNETLFGRLDIVDRSSWCR